MSPDRYASNCENSNGAVPSLHNSKRAHLLIQNKLKEKKHCENHFSFERNNCFTHPAEKISISGKRLAVLFCSFVCSPSIIDAESNELPPMSKPLFELLASVENDFTNLKWNIDMGKQ